MKNLFSTKWCISLWLHKHPLLRLPYIPTHERNTYGIKTLLVAAWLRSGSATSLSVRCIWTRLLWPAYASDKQDASEMKRWFFCFRSLRSLSLHIILSDWLSAARMREVCGGCCRHDNRHHFTQERHLDWMCGLKRHVETLAWDCQWVWHQTMRTSNNNRLSTEGQCLEWIVGWYVCFPI